MIRAELKTYLDEIESSLNQIEGYVLADKIGEILNAKTEPPTEKTEVAELIAFNFVENYSTDTSGWGSYYGPLFSLKNEKGPIEFPRLDQIDEDVINYWKTRALESPHPILANRYADLAFEFEPLVLKRNFDFRMAQKVVDSAINFCQLPLANGLDCKTKLERAFNIAVILNDQQRLDNLKSTIIEAEKKFSEDDKPGIWGYAFNLLLLKNPQKALLSDPEKAELVQDMEARLNRLMSSEDPNPWFVENAVLLLATYYSKNGDEVNLKLVVEKLEDAFRKNKHANSDGILVSNYLEKLIDIYSAYSSYSFANVSRERILNELSNVSKNIEFKTHEISVELKIEKEKIETIINAVLGKDNDQSVETTIEKIFITFLPRKDRVDKELQNLAKNHPIQFIMGNVIQSADGYPISKFGSIDESYDSHLLEHFSRNLHYQAISLRPVFAKLKEKHTPESIKKSLMLSPAFRSEDGDYVLKLLESFWSGDYIVASYLAVPLIEDAVRNLYRTNNLSFIKPNESGGYDVQSLDKLLSRGVIKIAYGKLGEDTEYYFRALLTERASWNLRNNFAHGINKDIFNSEDVSTRLIHVLFGLSLVRNNDKK